MPVLFNKETAMILKELLEQLEGLPDDTIIRIPQYDTDYDVEVCISGVDIDCDGSNGCQAEVVIW